MTAQRAGPATDSPRPLLTIRPRSGWPPPNLRELWEFRDLFSRLTRREITLRYRQTALGVVWVLLQPLLAAGVFSFVFGQVADLPSEGVPYFIFAYAGLLVWNVFNATLGKASGSLVANAGLVMKVFFPRLVLPLSGVGTTLIDFGVSLAVMAALLVVGGITPGAGVLLTPVWLVVVLGLGLGLGMAAAAFMVRFRDIGYMLALVTQLLLYGSPVAYGLTAVPDSARPFVLLNPLTGVLEAFRWSLLGTSNLHLGALAYSVVTSALVFWAGAKVFARMEREFADVI